MAMRLHFMKSSLKRTAGISIVLLLGANLVFAQQQVNLSAGPSTLRLPDGTSVPMWSYACGTAVTNSTATCASLNVNAPASGWSPVIITLPTGNDLQINLKNNLSFTPTGTASANGIPTSIVIVGQVGGGLGDLKQRTTA